MVSGRDPHRIASVQHEKDAKFQAGAELEKISQPANTQPGVGVRSAKDLSKFSSAQPDALLFAGGKFLKARTKDGR